MKMEKEDINLQTAEIQKHLRAIKKRNQQQEEMVAYEQVQPKRVLRKQFTSLGGDGRSEDGVAMDQLGGYQPKLGKFEPLRSPGEILLNEYIYICIYIHMLWQYTIFEETGEICFNHIPIV